MAQAHGDICQNILLLFFSLKGLFICLFLRAAGHSALDKLGGCLQDHKVQSDSEYVLWCCDDPRPQGTALTSTCITIWPEGKQANPRVAREASISVHTNLEMQAFSGVMCVSFDVVLDSLATFCREGGIWISVHALKESSGGWKAFRNC